MLREPTRAPRKGCPAPRARHSCVQHFSRMPFVHTRPLAHRHPPCAEQFSCNTSSMTPLHSAMHHFAMRPLQCAAQRRAPPRARTAPYRRVSRRAVSASTSTSRSSMSTRGASQRMVLPAQNSPRAFLSPRTFWLPSSSCTPLFSFLRSYSYYSYPGRTRVAGPRARLSERIMRPSDGI